jgi:hypothetical protein
MTTPRQQVDSEVWVLRSLLRDRGVMEIELDKHLERVQLLIQSLLKKNDVA